VGEGQSWALAGLDGVRQFRNTFAALKWLESLPPRETTETHTLRVAGEGRLPERAHDSDAGFDLYYHGTERLVVCPGECVDVPAAVSVEWPHGWWGFLVGRSSSFRNRGLLVNPAVIDAGFRGELFAIVRNIGDEPCAVEPGERVAQIVPFPTWARGLEVERVELEELSESERGAAGFGSSGL
jgi:dUTP pyrophosphatase